MFCAQCGLEVTQENVSWVAVGRYDQEDYLLCPGRDRYMLGAGWKHVPVETEEEVILAVLSKGAGLRDYQELVEPPYEQVLL